ncbi:MAG: 4Fe-4S binding protein [Rickettsiales bacterium]|nr:4Fe-4S binding protein [Rickettsiales bacterium]
MVKRFFNKNFALRWGLRFLVVAAFYNVASKNMVWAVVYLFPYIFGAIACGWVCPTGLVQDLVFVKKFGVKIPDKIHKKLRWLRYIFASAMVANFLFIFSNIQHGISNLLKLQFAGAYIPMAFVIASMFVERFFCRYFCPFGAIAGLKSLVRPTTIARDKSTCVNCKICDKVCPMQIKVSEIDSSYSPNCVDCFKCVEKCPKKSLQIKIRNYRPAPGRIKDNL